MATRIPAVRVCALCDQVRLELGGKYTMLGVFGFAPNVRILVGEIPANVELTFMVAFEMPSKSGKTLISPKLVGPEKTGSPWKQMEFEWEKDTTPMLVFSVRHIQFMNEGEYRFELWDEEDNEVYSTMFIVAKAPEGMLLSGSRPTRSSPTPPGA